MSMFDKRRGKGGRGLPKEPFPKQMSFKKRLIKAATEALSHVTKIEILMNGKKRSRS